MAVCCLYWYTRITMPETERAEVRLGKQGRLVIPSALREALSIGPGDRLMARIVDGRLVLEPRERVWETVRGRFATVPGEPSLVDELIAERRAEARRAESG